MITQQLPQQQHNTSSEQQRRKERFLRALARSTKQILSGLEADSPPAFQPFLDTMKRTFLDAAAAPGGSHAAPLHPGKKVVGVYCIMAPEELIYAAGAVPLRLCGGSSEAALAGDELVPRDICPVVRAAAGFTALGLLPIYQRCDAVVVPTTCDGKRKLGEVLSDYVQVWMLEVPHLKEAERSRMEWIDQIYALKSSIEKLVGKKIKRRALREAVGKVAQARYQARRLHELRRADPPVVFGRHAMLALNAYAFEAVDSWSRAMQTFNDELERRRLAGERVGRAGAPRILLAGSPAAFPNWKLPMLIEEMGAVIVADETCAAGRYLYDPVGIAEGSMTEMMRAIAARLIMPCTCPSFSPNDDRLYRLRQMVQEFRVDGVIYHVLKGCLIYDFEVARVERAMKEIGVPLLRVETDYSPEDVEPLRTRVEAFVEMTGAAHSKARDSADAMLRGN